MNAHGTTCSGCAPALGAASLPGVPLAWPCTASARRKAQVSTLSFERPKEFDLAQYDANGRFGFGYGEKVRLTFEVETEAGFHLTETPLSRDQDVQVLNAEWMQISATVVDSAMLEWWLRGFGEAVRNIRKIEVKSCCGRL